MKRTDGRRYGGIEVRSSGAILVAAGMVVWSYRGIQLSSYPPILLALERAFPLQQTNISCTH